jgi:murein DD-endopeptidase MepM/ murein hydrolase activator NlpD
MLDYVRAALNQHSLELLSALLNAALRGGLLFLALFAVSAKWKELRYSRAYWVSGLASLAVLYPLGLLLDPTRPRSADDPAFALVSAQFGPQGGILHLREPLLTLRLNPDSLSFSGEPLFLSFSPASWIIFAYSIGVGFFAAKLAAALRGLHALRLGSIPPDPRLSRLAEEAARGVGARCCSVAYSAKVETPLAYGLLRHRILVPLSGREWGDEDLRSALIHEMCHARSGDYALNLAAWVLCSLFWFLPPVHAARKRLRAALEFSCDKKVVGRGVDPLRYAELLVRTARAGKKAARDDYGVEVRAARQSGLETRVDALVSGRAAKRGLSSASGAIVGAAVMALCVPLSSAVTPVGAEKAPRAFVESVGGVARLSSPYDQGEGHLFSGSRDLPFVWPLARGAGRECLAESLCPDPEAEGLNRHRGLSIEDDSDSMVISAADGIVERVRQDADSYFVLVRHKRGLRSGYSRLATLASGLREGSTLAQGAPIGAPRRGDAKGTTSFFFTLSQGSSFLDPRLYLSAFGARVFTSRYLGEGVSASPLE